MKRYALFVGEVYYPAGGWNDFVDSFDTVVEARAKVSRPIHDWWQIVDLQTGEVVVER